MTVENTQPEPTGTTQQEDADLVSIYEASDEDLDAYLKDNAEEGLESDGEPEGNEETISEEPATTAQTSAPERPKEDPKPGDKQPQEAAKQPTPEEREAHLQAVIAEQKRRIEQTELWAKRRSTELGETRKQLREANARLNQGLEDRLVESPAQALDDHATIRENEKAIQAIDQEEATIQHALRAQKVVAHFIKPEEMPSFDEMAGALQADGVDEEYVNTFKSNPYLSMYPETLVHLAKRTAVEKALRQVVGFTRQVLAENEKLKGEVKSRPNAVLKNVEAALRKSPAMTGASGGSAETDGIPSADPSQWSDAQLDEFLANAK